MTERIFRMHNGEVFVLDITNPCRIIQFDIKADFIYDIIDIESGLIEVIKDI